MLTTLKENQTTVRKRKMKPHPIMPEEKEDRDISNLKSISLNELPKSLQQQISSC